MHRITLALRKAEDALWAMRVNNRPMAVRMVRTLAQSMYPWNTDYVIHKSGKFLTRKRVE